MEGCISRCLAICWISSVQQVNLFSYSSKQSHTPTNLANSHWGLDGNKLNSPQAHFPIKVKKKKKKERSLCHNDSFRAIAHSPVHLKFIKFQFPPMPSSNNIVIQEVQETIYPNSSYACKCLTRLVMHTVVSGSLLYLTHLYINFGQQEFYAVRLEFCVCFFSRFEIIVLRMFYSFQKLTEFSLKYIIVNFIPYLLMPLKIIFEGYYTSLCG